MKFIMVILICISGHCQSIYEERLYDTKAICESEAMKAKAYMMSTYPDSEGEIHCLDEKEFQEYWDWWLKQTGVESNKDA
jgi:hypothetical protein